jgi:hypothetical protein
MPLRLDPMVTNPYPGATTIQRYFNDSTCSAPATQLRSHRS